MPQKITNIPRPTTKKLQSITEHQQNMLLKEITKKRPIMLKLHMVIVKKQRNIRTKLLRNTLKKRVP
jgi:hypothetical protein